MTTRTGILRPLLALAVGALIFATGVILARRWLPDWQSERLPPQAFFVQRYGELARQAGIRPAPGAPRITFAKHDKSIDLDESVVDGLAPGMAAEVGAGLIVDARHRGTLEAKHDRRELIAHFSASGYPLLLQFGSREETVKGALQKGPPPSPELQSHLTSLLLRPGEKLGPPTQGAQGGLKGVAGESFLIQGSQPPQRITAGVLPGGTIVVVRQLVEPAESSSGFTAGKVAEIILMAVPFLCGILTAVILFFVLLGRRRIDLVSGARLGALLLVTATVPTLADDLSWAGSLAVLGAFFIALWAFVVWSSGESYLRSVQSNLTVSLDALLHGRLGPRGGRALVWGVAGGAALAGLRLAAEAVAARLPGAWPEEGSLRLPIFGVQTPFNDGVVLAGGIALALGLAWKFVPARWATAAAVLAAGLAIPFVNIHPWPFQMGVDIAAAGLLVVLCLRAGLAAGLTAALGAYLLQAAAFAALYPAWLPASLAVTAGTPALLLLLGFVGFRRRGEAEIEQLKQPAFMKRIEEERRIKYEMDLLARMQLGLLPQQLPRITGWEIAATSLLATEAGGDLYDFFPDEEGFLWIAAGDVAGHGYSCSIAQAMTVASLSSLITSTQTPAGVLQRVDRVLRRNTHRHFTTLVLLRLEPRSGIGQLANAGHPYAMLSAEGLVSEIPLAGLPLGQGPKRDYANVEVEIPPGAALVFCSDGLFEATDSRGISYGYERPREVLHNLAGKSATEILDGVMADWRRYRGAVEQEDDTTVVVVKRLVKAAASPA